MYHLFAFNRGLIKSYSYVSFLPFEKSFTCYEKYFQFHLYIFLKKNLLVNKYKKQTSYKVKKSLFFDVMKNGNIFHSKVCHFKFDHRFLFCREMGNISA